MAGGGAVLSVLPGPENRHRLPQQCLESAAHELPPPRSCMSGGRGGQQQGQQLLLRGESPSSEVDHCPWGALPPFAQEAPAELLPLPKCQCAAGAATSPSWSGSWAVSHRPGKRGLAMAPERVGHEACVAAADAIVAGPDQGLAATAGIPLLRPRGGRRGGCCSSAAASAV